LDDATENVVDERVDVARATVSVLLVLLELKYCSVASWVALNDTSPAPTRVIKLPDASMVATFGLLLLYRIAPLLLLVGRVVIANDTSPNVLDDATVKVADAKVDATGEEAVLIKIIPLEFTPSPPYKSYVVPFIVADVTFVYVSFAFT
jgi:hypothetical protein